MRAERRGPARGIPGRIARGLARAIGWTLLLLAIVVVAALQIARMPASRLLIRDFVLSQTRPIVPGLSFGEIRGDYTSELTVTDVVLADRFGGEAIRIERVTLRYRLAGLIRRKVRVDLVEIVRPRVTLRTSRSGQLNLAELVVPTPEQEPEAPAGPLRWTVSLARLQLSGGAIVVAIDPAQVTRVQDLELQLSAGVRPGRNVLDLPGLSLQLERTAASVQLPDGRAIDLRLALGAAVAHELSAEIDLDATLTEPGKTAIARKARLRLKAAGPLARLRLSGELHLPGEGRLDLDGWAGLRADGKPAYDLTARLSGLDPAALLAELPQGDVNLEVRAQGEDVPLQPGARAALQLQLRPTTALGYKVDAARVKAALDGNRWRIERAEVRVGPARLNATGSGDLSRFTGTVGLEVPRLDDLPLPRAAPRLAGKLQLTAEGTGRLGHGLAGRLRINGRDLALDRLRVARVDLDTRLQRLPLSAPDLQALLSALRATVGLQVEGVSQDGQALVDRASVAAAGTQRALELRVKAAGPLASADIDARASVDADRLRLDLRRLRASGMGYDVALRDRSRVTYRFSGALDLPPTRLAALGGELVVGGVYRTRGFPRLKAEVQLSRVQLPLGERPRVSATLSAELGRHHGRARLRASLPHGSRLALRADVPVRHVRGSPTLAAQRDLDLALSLSRLPLGLAREVLPDQPALRPLRGAVSIEARLQGKLAAPRGELRLDLHRAGYGEQVAGLGGQIAAHGDDQRVAVSSRLSLDNKPMLKLRAAVAAGLGSLIEAHRRGTLAPEQLPPVELALEVPGLRLARLVPLAPRLKQVSGVAHLALNGRGTLGRAQFELRAGLREAVLAGHRLGALETRLELGVEPGQVKTRLTALEGGLVVAEVNASAPLDLRRALADPSRALKALTLRASGRVPGYDLHRLRQLDPLLGRTAGRLSGTFSAAGSLARPTARAHLSLTRAVFDGVDLGDLVLQGAYQPQAATAEVRFAQRQGGKLTLGARVGLADGSLSARVKSSALDLKPLRSLVPAIRDSAGQLTLDLTAGGTLARPAVRGTIRLREGALRLSGLPLLSNLRADVAISPGRVQLERLHLESGGSLDVQGRVDLDPTFAPRAFGLQAKADDLRLTFGNIRDAELNGPLRVTGRVSPAGIEATVLLDGSRLKIPQISGGRQLHATSAPKDVVFVDGPARPSASRAGAPAPSSSQRKPGHRPGDSGIPIELVVLTTPLFVHGKEADVEVATKLRIAVDAGGRARIHGRVRLRRGWVQVLKNRYDIGQALVLFSGNPEPNPALDVQLSHRFPEATVHVGLQGTARSPRLELRADPPIYDQSQILSLILTGRTTPVGAGAETDKGVAVASFFAQQLLGGLMDKVGDVVGLDVATVSLDTSKSETGETQVRPRGDFGKFLTDRLYIGYRPLIGATEGENTNEGLFEYRISTRWLLMGTFGDAGVGGLDLFWVHRY